MKTGRGYWFIVFLFSIAGVGHGVEAIFRKVWTGTITIYGSHAQVIGWIVVCLFLSTAAVALRMMMRPRQ